jgi:hypothetical protein
LDQTLRIGVIGGLSVGKGALVVAACAELALAQRQKVEFILIGHSPVLKSLNLPNVVITGRYEDKNLQSLIKRHELGCILLPSVIPETYMYTLSSAIESRLPVFVFNLGAQAERAKSYSLGFRIPLAFAQQPKRILGFIRQRLS